MPKVAPAREEFTGKQTWQYQIKARRILQAAIGHGGGWVKEESQGK
jgi:hypothetical protein